MTRENDPEAKKEKKDDDVGEDGDYMTKFVPANNLVPTPEEDQDSYKYDDA